jgi:hypothetical protein
VDDKRYQSFLYNSKRSEHIRTITRIKMLATLCLLGTAVGAAAHTSVRRPTLSTPGPRHRCVHDIAIAGRTNKSWVPQDYSGARQ